MSATRSRGARPKIVPTPKAPTPKVLTPKVPTPKVPTPKVDAEPKKPLDVGTLIASLLGRRTVGTCPPWPPDVFAVAASLMRRTSAYVEIVERWRPPTGFGEHCRTVGAAWRECWMRREPPPPDVVTAWRALSAQRDVPVGTPRPTLALVDPLAHLLAYSDETAHDVGTTSRHPFVRDAELLLALSGSLGREVSAQAVTVLPKIHTPRAGMTLRSLSHHLAVIEAPDVTPHWASRPARDRPIDRLSALLLPWPLEMSPRAFHFGATTSGHWAEGHGMFRYEAAPFPQAQALEAIEEANRRAASPIDVVVLPEQALTEDEAIELAEASGVTVIAGVHGGPNARENASIVVDPQWARGPRSRGHGVSRFRQQKHHRWCLDAGQIRRYGLGARLDPSSAHAYWEDIALGRREVYFHAFDDDLTYSVLVCEDLARQDPLADVLRAVGPSLIFALLLDGPQLVHRWPARYAAVLAEDPGSSVLTLTSYGMAQLSRPPSPAIALFGDGSTGAITELALAPGAVGLVVTLARRDTTEVTADSRKARSHALVIESVLDVHRRF